MFSTNRNNISSSILSYINKMLFLFPCHKMLVIYGSTVTNNQLHQRPFLPNIKMFLMFQCHLWTSASPNKPSHFSFTSMSWPPWLKSNINISLPQNGPTYWEIWSKWYRHLYVMVHSCSYVSYSSGRVTHYRAFPVAANEKIVTMECNWRR